MRRRPAFCLIPGLATRVTLVLLCAPMARADDVRIHGELGAEYDDNVHWTSNDATVGPPRTGSPLSRVVLGIAAADRLAARQDVAFSILGAAKTFAAPAARSENVAVVETSGAWRITVGERTRLGLHGGYFEAIQAGTATERQLSQVARDFRSLSPTFRIATAIGQAGTAGLVAGYRWFDYKPLRSYDFGAPVLGLEYRHSRETADGQADWEAAVSTSVELRRFAGTRLIRDPLCAIPVCTALSDPEMGRHQDQFFAFRLDVTRTGRVLLGAGYAMHWNRSNSYSETLIRNAGTLRLTVPLPFGFYLAARAELVYLAYPDRAAFPRGPSGQARLTIEDENRSHVRAELSRDISRRFQIIGRYTLYVNALGQGAYERQTATLALAFMVD